MKTLSVFVFAVLAGSISFASVDCPSSYPNGTTLSYSDGTLNYPNGNRLRYSDGTMNYPNGNRLRYSDGTMNYENGNRLRYSDGTMNYPNGNRLRYSDGTLRDQNGNSTTGSVSLSTDFGQQNMRIVARRDSAKFETPISYGNGIMLLEFDEDGNVTCTIDGGSGTQEFRVEGNKGSAYVTVKPGENAAAIKASIQRVLDGQ